MKQSLEKDKYTLIEENNKQAQWMMAAILHLTWEMGMMCTIDVHQTYIDWKFWELHLTLPTMTGIWCHQHQWISARQLRQYESDKKGKALCKGKTGWWKLIATHSLACELLQNGRCESVSLTLNLLLELNYVMRKITSYWMLWMVILYLIAVLKHIMDGWPKLNSLINL